MMSLENWEDLKAAAREAGQRERESIAARLEAGEEIQLHEAVTAFGIWPRESWRLGAFSGRGRYGGALEPHTQIPSSAWDCIRWQTDGRKFVLVTPEGAMVYDVRLCTSEPARTFAEDGEAEDDTVSPAPVEQTAQAMVEPSVVLQSIVETKRPDDRRWMYEEYKTELARAGITIVRRKHDRVSGITIGNDGRIERAGGAIYLTNALLVTRFALAKSDGFLSNCRTKRDVARALHRWLAVDHPNILGVRAEASDDLKATDALADLLRLHFGDFLQQVSGANAEE